MEHFRGHAWLKQYRAKLPKTWAPVRVTADGEVFEDGKARPVPLDPAVAAHLQKQAGNCAGCG